MSPLYYVFISFESALNRIDVTKTGSSGVEVAVGGLGLHGHFTRFVKNHRMGGKYQGSKGTPEVHSWYAFHKGIWPSECFSRCSKKSHLLLKREHWLR